MPKDLAEELLLNETAAAQAATTGVRQRALKPRPARLPRSTGLFAQVSLAQLTDRQWDDLLPARTRLYLYVLIKSHRGTKPAKLPNALALEIGLSKQNKMRELRWLAAHGYVTFDMTGHRTPVVSVHASK